MSSERADRHTRDIVTAVIGDVAALTERVVSDVHALGIDVSDLELSHVAYRCTSIEAYVEKRDALEAVCVANVENEWHGRPISKLLLAPPIELGGRHALSLIELIPPPHDPRYGLGLEHIGFVVGSGFAAFGRRHAAVISGQQDQGPFNQPFFITLGEGRLVKFHERSLRAVTELEGRRFEV